MCTYHNCYGTKAPPRPTPRPTQCHFNPQTLHNAESERWHHESIQTLPSLPTSSQGKLTRHPESPLVELYTRHFCENPKNRTVIFHIDPKLLVELFCTKILETQKVKKNFFCRVAAKNACVTADGWISTSATEWSTEWQTEIVFRVESCDMTFVAL